MNSNLKTGSAIKELLLKKLSYAVTCSVLSHVAVVIIYIFMVNFSFQFTEWMKGTFDTLTSFSTWLYLIPFCSIIFTQIMICAKDYVLRSTYQLSRFKKFVSIFSVRTFILGLLHVIAGGLVIWLYLSLTEGPYQALVKYNEVDYSLIEGSFYLVLSGLWTGLYFFIHAYTADKTLVFPVVQQRKLLNFKAKFLSLFRESKSISVYPTISFFILYHIFGPYLRDTFVHTFKLTMQQKEDFSLWLYLYTWIFSVLYILNMNLMRFFFELFLTEPVEHPVMAIYDNDASLPEALLLNNLPILQHLACLDLYLLSVWSPQRRQALYTLSQPGGHPHTWNRLIQGALKLMSEFTDTLNKSADALLNKEEKPAPIIRNQILLGPAASLHSPLQKPQKFPNMRNMSLTQPVESVDIVNITQTAGNTEVSDISEAITATAVSRIANFTEKIKNVRTIKYIFGELPETHIQHCLNNGQLIVWITQGLANVAVASFSEDPYGVIQKDLPVLITSLVQLKQSVDKLNKVPVFSKKGQNLDDFSFKMKNSVHSAVKRSLCNICRTFGKYLNDIPLNSDTAAQLQCYL